MNLRIVDGKSGFSVGADFRQFAAPKRGRPGGVMSLQLKPRIAGLFRQRQQPFAKSPSRVYFASSPPEQPLAPQRRENLRALAQTFAKFFGSGIGFQDFRRAKSPRRHERGP